MLSFINTCHCWWKWNGRTAWEIEDKYYNGLGSNCNELCAAAQASWITFSFFFFFFSASQSHTLDLVLRPGRGSKANSNQRIWGLSPALCHPESPKDTRYTVIIIMAWMMLILLFRSCHPICMQAHQNIEIASPGKGSILRHRDCPMYCYMVPLCHFRVLLW